MTAHVLAVEKVSKVYPENREFRQIFPDVIEPVLHLRIAQGYPREQYEVQNLYMGEARYDAYNRNRIIVPVVRLYRWARSRSRNRS